MHYCSCSFFFFGWCWCQGQCGSSSVLVLFENKLTFQHFGTGYYVVSLTEVEESLVERKSWWTESSSRRLISCFSSFGGNSCQWFQLLSQKFRCAAASNHWKKWVMVLSCWLFISHLIMSQLATYLLRPLNSDDASQPQTKPGAPSMDLMHLKQSR